MTYEPITKNKMNINYEPDRAGLTVLPDMIDEATGQRIEGSSKVVDTRVTNWEGQSPETYEDLGIDEVEQDALAPDDQDPEFSTRLADTFEEINTTSYDVNPDMANTIAQADIGDSPEAITIKYLASKVYGGDMTPEESFQKAVESGLDMDKLMFHYYQLKQQFPESGS